MKEVLLDANFPRDAKGATYHVGTAPGQVANRIITVGDFVRARRIASHFDGGQAKFEHLSHRNFLTLTGTYSGVPISVVAIGMGFPMVDFFVRECRAVVQGDLVIVRMGSCGSIGPDVPLGSVAVPLRSYGLTRNFDWFHPSTTDEERKATRPYHVSKPFDADRELHDSLTASLEQTTPSAQATLFEGREPITVSGVANGSADSFYSSQGRLSGDAFWDSNDGWVEELADPRGKYGISTLEMEQYLIQHLAHAAAYSSQGIKKAKEADVIRTASVQMVFANRHTSAFITPDEVKLLELWASKAVCETLAKTSIDRVQTRGVWT